MLAKLILNIFTTKKWKTVEQINMLTLTWTSQCMYALKHHTISHKYVQFYVSIKNK
jgi:hypothetical protein